MSAASRHHHHQRFHWHHPALIWLIAFVAGLLALLLSVTPAAGRGPIRNAFFEAYPSALGTQLDTLPSAASHCGVCHYQFGGGGPRNPFGAAVEAVLPMFPNNQKYQAILSIGADPRTLTDSRLTKRSST